MNKFVSLLVTLVAIAVGVFVLYPQETKFALISVAFRANVLIVQYIHNASNAEQSYESIAFENMLRLRDFSSPDYLVARKNLDSFGLTMPLGPRTVEQIYIKRDDKSDLPVYWVTPPVHDNKTIIMYLHGGAYIAGSFVSHAGPVSELARRTEAKVIFVEYRLAPEHHFPAMVDDAITAYEWLIYDQKISANRIVLVGDSAGGGLVLLTVLALQDEDKGTIPAPAAAVTFSAWTDLSCDRPAYEQNQHSDALLNEAFLTFAAALATNTKPEDRAARKSHKFSPIFAPSEKLAKLPPLYMSVGDAEILYDDTAHFAGKANQAGADVKLVVGHHMQHIWAYFFPFVPEGGQELSNVAHWIQEQKRNK